MVFAVISSYLDHTTVLAVARPVIVLVKPLVDKVHLSP